MISLPGLVKALLHIMTAILKYYLSLIQLANIKCLTSYSVGEGEKQTFANRSVKDAKYAIVTEETSVKL